MAQRTQSKKGNLPYGNILCEKNYHQKVLGYSLKQNSPTGTETPKEPLLRCHKLPFGPSSHIRCHFQRACVQQIVYSPGQYCPQHLTTAPCRIKKIKVVKLPRFHINIDISEGLL